MGKLSWMKWYPDDWMRDTRSLSIEAKGCWIEILMLMWNAENRGVWTGTHEEFARVTGSPWESAGRLVRELTKVANLTESDKILTLKNRRMIKEQTAHETNAKRQREYYHNAKPNKNLTDKTPLDSSRLLKTPQDNTKTKRVIFVKPSAEEVTAYGASIGFRIVGAAFCDFYESKAWKIGNSPMRSWQAAVRTWKHKAKEDGHGASQRESIFDWNFKKGEQARSHRPDSELRKAGATPGQILNDLGIVRLPEEDRKEEPAKSSEPSQPLR